MMAAPALNACAAPATVTDAEPQQQMRPHFHLQEKTGISQSAPEAIPDKTNAANDRTTHVHHRVGTQASTKKTGLEPVLFV